MPNFSAARSAFRFCCTCRFLRHGLTAIVTYGILLLERRGFRPIELIIGGLVGVIGLCYLIELSIAPLGLGRRGLSRFGAGDADIRRR